MVPIAPSRTRIRERRRSGSCAVRARRRSAGVGEFGATSGVYPRAHPGRPDAPLRGRHRCHSPLAIDETVARPTDVWPEVTCDPLPRGRHDEERERMKTRKLLVAAMTAALAIGAIGAMPVAAQDTGTTLNAQTDAL